MRTISVAVSEDDYEAFRRAARRTHGSIAQMIREAMAWYRSERLDKRTRLEELPILVGHRLIGELPTKDELYDEMFIREEEA